MLTVQDIGEQGVLKIVQQFCPPELIQDDAAVLLPPVGRLLVVTSDVLVDGVHFSDRTTSPEDVGWRSAAVNLSDLAAMGATPIGITVGLSLPGNLAVDWVKRLYQGLSLCLQQFQTVIVGGDVVRSSLISVAIAAFGAVLPNRVIRRSGAQPGDQIVVTGPHGAARAGLELLLHPERGQPRSPDFRAHWIHAHQRPLPRLDVIPHLPWDLLEQTPTAARIAGMDSSDGLADAVIQLCRTSQVGARIDRGKIPLPEGLAAWVGRDQALDWALYGGEDFELVLCLPPLAAALLLQQLGAKAACIGTITAEPGAWLVDSTGQFEDQPLVLEHGFQHFATSRL